MSAVSDNVFAESLEACPNDDTIAVHAEDCRFALLMGEEISDSLRLMDMEAEVLDSRLSASGDSVYTECINLTDTIDGAALNASAEDEKVYETLLAVKHLNCAPFHELNLSSLIGSTDSVHSFASQSLNQDVPLSLTHSSQFSQRVDSDGNNISMGVLQALISGDIVVTPSMDTSSDDKPLISNVATLLNNLDGGSSSINDIMTEELDTFSPPQGNKSLGQASVHSGEDGSKTCRELSGGRLDIQRNVPCLQRSQSSDALGQVKTSTDSFSVSQADGSNIPLACCKQQHPHAPTKAPSSCANIVSLFQSSTLSSHCQTVDVPVRRVYSTGDLQGYNGFKNANKETYIPEKPIGVKIGHCTSEERKMKLHRYRQKRTERNFSKKIKYACRKTLADNRPRVRGRFARSDEMVESIVSASDLPPYSDMHVDAVTSYGPCIASQDQQAFLMGSNSCIMSSNLIAQFWSTLGMKAVM
ncbi:hypothetical protein KP509_27G059800 [Ceratopteris richardii]|nr:hypothetical protein KP509_27G059800 [Ceratopteris richardii]